MATIQKLGNVFPNLTTGLFETTPHFNSFFRDMDRNFDSMLSIPSVNITENEKDFKIEMAAPGFERKDFKVAIENGLLTISAESKNEKKEKKKNYTLKEYSYNGFKRSFSLPDNCIIDLIDATYENGILNIKLPKKENGIHPAKEIKVS